MRFREVILQIHSLCLFFGRKFHRQSAIGITVKRRKKMPSKMKDDGTLFVLVIPLFFCHFDFCVHFSCILFFLLFCLQLWSGIANCLDFEQFIFLFTSLLSPIWLFRILFAKKTRYSLRILAIQSTLRTFAYIIIGILCHLCNLFQVAIAR